MSEKRIFAYIDILGFKEMVKTQNSGKAHDVLKNFVYNDSLKMNTDFEIINFSDTIIFYTKQAGFSQQLFDDIIYISRMFVIEMLQQKIPVRGVINYGELNIDIDSKSKTKMYWGQGLIDAYEAEKTENLIGLFVLPEAIRIDGSIQTLQELYPSRYHVKYDNRVLVNLFQRIADIPKDDFDLGYYIDEDPDILTEVRAHLFLEKSKDKYSGKKADKYRNALRLAEKFIYHDIRKLYRFVDKKPE